MAIKSSDETAEKMQQVAAYIRAHAQEPLPLARLAAAQATFSADEKDK